MMNEAMVTVSGNLVSDVELRTTPRGDALARFRVASTVKRFDRSTGSWLDGDTVYWNVTAWRRAAENAALSLAKGHPVVVHGKVRQRTVDREVQGAPGVRVPTTFTDLEAISFGLDLTRCRSAYQRAPIGPQTSVQNASPSGAASGGVGGDAEVVAGAGAVGAERADGNGAEAAGGARADAA